MNICPHKNLYVNGHGSVTMPKKGKCPSTDECIKNVVNPDNGILHNNKKEWIIDIWNNTVEHQKHNAK